MRFLVEWLQDVVECADLKGFYRILVKGGGENDAGQRNLFLQQFLDDAKTVQTGHLHVEKDQVGGSFLDQVDGFHAVLALANDFEVFDIAQQVGEFIACKLFIVHDDDG